MMAMDIFKHVPRDTPKCVCERLVQIDREQREHVVRVLLTKGDVSLLLAEELWQGVLQWVWKCLADGSWKEPPSMRATLVRTALSSLSMERKDRHRRKWGWDFFDSFTDLQAAAESGGGDVVELLDFAQAGIAKITDDDAFGERYLSHLNERQRECFVVKYMQEVSRQDGALYVGVTVRQLDGYAYNGRKRLQKLVGGLERMSV